MALNTLYPPVVETIAPAFVAGGVCRILFSLSKFSNGEKFRAVLISVEKQSTGQNVVDRSQEYNKTGIIISNGQEFKDKNNKTYYELNTQKDGMYYVEITNDDIQGGWKVDQIYKIQLRLSTEAYTSGTQYQYINKNDVFTEWSSYCTVKAIKQPIITLPDVLGNYTNEKEKKTDSLTTISWPSMTFEFSGSYQCTSKEPLYSYVVELKDDATGETVETSDIIYIEKFKNKSTLHYLFKKELTEGKTYQLYLEYITLNKFTERLRLPDILINTDNILRMNINAICIDTVDNIDDVDFRNNFHNETSIQEECEEGRIAIKLYCPDQTRYSGNICLRKASSKDNFQTWEDIQMIVCKNSFINDLPVFYDMFIESGVWYKYGVQTVETDGVTRSLMNAQRSPVLREFEYSYLIGEGSRQLKLKFNNVINSYTYNYSESKTETIGGQFPTITRNGTVKYRSFPISALISFKMDDNQLFTNDLELYKYADIIDQYQTRRRQNHIDHYDYKREFDFREKVLEFLQDGKPKLFRSSTEGNIIVRLMDVSTQPNQSLNRMLYSFSANAYEIAEDTLANYKKYKFFEVGVHETSFETYEKHIGQLDIDYNPNEDIIDQIWKNFDFSKYNQAGLRITLKKIHHLKLQFSGPPLLLSQSTDKIFGNAINYNGKRMLIPGFHNRVYVFDESISFTKDDKITVLGDDEVSLFSNSDLTGLIKYHESDKEKNPIHVEANFIYEIAIKPYVEKEIASRTVTKGISQLYKNFAPNTDLYREMYYKYYYEWELNFGRLNEIRWTCIETEPGAVFMLRDSTDPATGSPKLREHEINETGLLNLVELGTIRDIKYLGMRKSNGEIDTSKSVDVVLDYLYYKTDGTYKEKEA